MGTRIVDLAARRAAREEARARELETLRWVLAVQADAEQAAFELALAGPWRTWDEEQPEGATVTVDLEDLLGTGDPAVTAVAQVAAAAWEAVEALRERLPDVDLDELLFGDDDDDEGGGAGEEKHDEPTP